MLHFKYPVNVSSVPQLSVFRYPGGKTWFVPYLRLWLKAKQKRPEILFEPFGGGGIIGLTSASEKLCEKAHINELDPIVAAVWKTTLCEDYEWLCKRIIEFNLTVENVMEVLASDTESTRDRAFKTILRNRCGHGGILADGGGLLKHGENGRGISSRWYPETLAKRITSIFQLRERIIFSEADGLDLMEKYGEYPNVCYFIDPPYTAGKKGKRAGKRLYRYSEVDHERLFNISSKVNGDFLITYDNDKEVSELAAAYNMKTALIPMKNTHNTTMNELVICKDISWACVNLADKDNAQLELSLKCA
jgi:DNA adenine methylase